jgi:tRNA modification GTPase
MLGSDADAIVAVATAPGRGAVGIVRVSSPRPLGLAHLVNAWLRPPPHSALKPREATYLPFPDAAGQPIDRGLALWFDAPHSYTGEDVLELQAHGGPVVLQLLLARCLELAQTHKLPMRVAEPGEFTRRAFLNDKLDLAQAEAVADLIDASTEAAARSASRALAGDLSQRVQALAAGIVRLRTLVEATLDFPEEEIEFLEKANARGVLAGLRAELQALQAATRQGVLLREGIRVVLAGQPNVGKSSLLNALAGAELAIVTPIAGTTRDKVSETIQIEGVPVTVVDTAGLRPEAEAADEVERIGMARTWDAIADAQVLLVMHDLARAHEANYREAQAGLEADLAAMLTQTAAARLDVFTKADLAPEADVPDSATSQRLSSKTGEGLQALRLRLLALAGHQPSAEGVFIARARHVQALADCATHLQAAAEHAAIDDRALDLFAEELRLAHESLMRLTGQFSADELLGEIFSTFCIGK